MIVVGYCKFGLIEQQMTVKVVWARMAPQGALRRQKPAVRSIAVPVGRELSAQNQAGLRTVRVHLAGGIAEGGSRPDALRRGAHAPSRGRSSDGGDAPRPRRHVVLHVATCELVSASGRGAPRVRLFVHAPHGAVWAGGSK